MRGASLLSARSYQYVDLTIDGSAATVRLNRPEKKNALSPDLHANLRDALDEIESAGDVKAVVLTGTGDSFCAGMDLEKQFLEPYDDPDRFARQAAVSNGNFRRIKSFPAVTIAKVNGWAFGGGMELAGICDIVVTSETAVFGLSEINFGIFPAGGAMWATAHNLPRKQALYYALTGNRFTGAEAVALGLATKAVPVEELDAAVDAVVADIVNKNLHALRATKRAYEWSDRLDFDESNEVELALRWQLSYYSGNEWINNALTQFRDRKYRPGLESYELPASSPA
jgi:trans-feruloyl-CoA hydratase/vanillin synthase